MKNYECVEVMIKPENIFLVPDEESYLYKAWEPHYYQAMAYQDGLLFKEMGYVGSPESYYEDLKSGRINPEKLTGEGVLAFGPATDTFRNDRFLRPFIDRMNQYSLWMTGWEVLKDA